MIKEDAMKSGTQKKSAVLIAIIMMISIVGIYYFNMEKTPDPMPTLGTSIISTTPTGTAVPIEAPITIQFDGSMNKESLEAAFSIYPIKLGSFSWVERTNIDGELVRFIPMNHLRPGTRYTVTIDNGAVDVDGVNLTTGISQFNFTTEGEATSIRNVGTGTDDFWIQYPLSHMSSNQSVEHPDWVENAVDTEVVLILSRREGCGPCIEQTAICEDINRNSSEYIEYFNMLASFDDPESTFVFSNYSPEGYWAIPLTIVLTKVRDSNGNDAIGWHSWIGVVDEETLTSWLEDAITHHNET